MSKEFNLSFQYKGGRNYVHGTDVYNAVVKALRDQGHNELNTFDMAFHKVIQSNLKCELVEGKSVTSTEGLAALIRFQNQGIDYLLSMRENGSPVEGRYPYAEDEICKAGVIDFEERKIELCDFPLHSNIEKIVALNKHLLSELFKDEHGKWYFGKLQITKDISDLVVNDFEIKLERNIGVKFTKSSIKLDGVYVGHIYFSMKF